MTVKVKENNLTIIEKFGLRLVQLRQQHNMSQRQFANSIGKAQSLVAMWELGQREVKLTTIEEVAKFFGVSISYMIGENVDSLELTREDARADDAKLVQMIIDPEMRQYLKNEDDVKSMLDVWKQINNTLKA